MTLYCYTTLHCTKYYFNYSDIQSINYINFHTVREATQKIAQKHFQQIKQRLDRHAARQMAFAVLNSAVNG